MKKLIFVILLLITVTGCAKKEITIYEDDEIDAFDQILTKIGNGTTKAYDLRSEEECYTGRIPKFFCARTKDINGNVKSLDTIYENLVLLIGKKYSYLIILMDNNNGEAKYLANKLFLAGYYNIHYFKSGYDVYAEMRKDSFIPEIGECTIC